jgi:hypothetical protein
VDVIGSFDETGLRESGDYGIYTAGTFRIEGEENEDKQPNFNLAMITCERQLDAGGTAINLECMVTQAVVWSTSEKPNTDKPNCSLDLISTTYSMKELQKGVLTGMENTSACYNTTLTIDRNTKRVYLSFTKTKEADKYDKTLPGTCGTSLPRTRVLMNCTGGPRIRKGIDRTPPRYCDFSSSSDK